MQIYSPNGNTHHSMDLDVAE